jgi:Acetoacetate decarboxylase (ADC)
VIIMHRYGSLDVKEWAASAPVIGGWTPEPWTLKGAHILECRTEIDDLPADHLVPAALRPSIPTYGAVVVSKFPESPVGPFALAELRIASRVGGRPVFFVLGAYCDNEAARRELSQRWGYRLAAGEIALAERHFRASATVSAGGRPVLEVELTHREPLPGTRFNTLAAVNLVRSRESRELVLAGLTAEIVYAKCDGGRQHIARLDGEAFNAGRWFRPLSPMTATIGIADVTLPAFEFTVDPSRPAE